MSLPHNSRCRAPYYDDDDDEKKTAADAMKDPDDPDKDRGRSTRTRGQTMTRADIHRAAREAMTYQEAMIPNRCCVICAKRLHPLQRQTPLLCAKRCIVHPPTAPKEGPDGPGWRPPFPQRPTCFSPPPQGFLILVQGPKRHWNESDIR